MASPDLAVTQIVLEYRRGIIMSQSTDPVQNLIAELRSAFETETTIGRILGRSKAMPGTLSSKSRFPRSDQRIAGTGSVTKSDTLRPACGSGWLWFVAALYGSGSSILYPPYAPAFHDQPAAARSWRARMGSLRYIGRRDGPANLPARGRWQRTGPSQVASAAADPSKCRRSHCHSSRRAACDNCSDGKLERGDPQP